MAKNNSYGIKEVADVKFVKIPEGASYIKAISLAADGKSILLDGNAISASDIAYQFDSLKVSNIEVASEDTSAKGGKGNPELISWSYGKEVTFTMEDALISMETLSLWLGGKEDGGDIITIDANSFPDMYTIIGETVMRSYATGKDEPFFFIIPKAKINVSGTITMEAEGDPSTFEMTIKAMSATVGQGVDEEKDVLVKFLHYGPASASIPNFSARVVYTNTSTGVEVTLTGVTGADTVTALGHAAATLDDNVVTVTATADSAPNETALINVKDSSNNIVAKVNVTFIAE